MVSKGWGFFVWKNHTCTDTRLKAYNSHVSAQLLTRIIRKILPHNGLEDPNNRTTKTLLKMTQPMSMFVFALLLVSAQSTLLPPRVENEFNMVEPQEVEGSIVNEIHARSLVECPSLCSRIPSCLWYQFVKSRDKNCVLIGKNDNGLQPWTSEQGGLVYKIDHCVDVQCENNGTCSDGLHSYTCTCVTGYTGEKCESETDECGTNPCQNGGTCTDGTNSYSCTCAQDFTGQTCETEIQALVLSDHVFYHNFENTTGITLQGATLVTGHVGSYAIQVTRSGAKHADLGTSASGACIVTGDCPSGGTMAVWINVIDCLTNDGIMTSHINLYSGLLISCSSTVQLISFVFLTGGHLDITYTYTSGWFHLVMVVNSGQTMLTQYVDGTSVGTDTTKSSSYVKGQGNLVLGRYFVDREIQNGNAEIDELKFWNRPLSQQEIVAL